MTKILMRTDGTTVTKGQFLVYEAEEDGEVKIEVCLKLE